MIEEVRRSYSRRRDDDPDHGVVQGHDGIKDDVLSQTDTDPISPYRELLSLTPVEST